MERHRHEETFIEALFHAISSPFELLSKQHCVCVVGVNLLQENNNNIEVFFFFYLFIVLVVLYQTHSKHIRLDLTTAMHQWLSQSGPAHVRTRRLH